MEVYPPLRTLHPFRKGRSPTTPKANLLVAFGSQGDQTLPSAMSRRPLWRHHLKLIHISSYIRSSKNKVVQIFQWSSVFPLRISSNFFQKTIRFLHGQPVPLRQGTTVEDIEKPIVFKISAWAILTTCNGRMDGGLKQQPPKRFTWSNFANLWATNKCNILLEPRFLVANQLIIHDWNDHPSRTDGWNPTPVEDWGYYICLPVQWQD